MDKVRSALMAVTGLSFRTAVFVGYVGGTADCCNGPYVGTRSPGGTLRADLCIRQRTASSTEVDAFVIKF